MAQSFIPMLSRFGTVGPWFVNDFVWQNTNSFYQERIVAEYISRFLLMDFRLDLFLWNMTPYTMWSHIESLVAQNVQAIIYYSTIYHESAWISGKATSVSDFHTIDDFLAFNCSVLKVSNFCIYVYNMYKAQIGAANFNIYVTGALMDVVNWWVLTCYNVGWGPNGVYCNYSENVHL